MLSSPQDIMEAPDGVRSRPAAHSIYTGLGDEDGEENVEELRERLRQMKAMVNERAATKKSGGGSRCRAAIIALTGATLPWPTI
ncbi:uncharacterized protein LOC121858527 isoform X4 [Homarus americanus]|uniref:uncharacterized protein LOC121858527 isoform X4 n=1 Tax=Homarus americanus TaxID=6706 RepID=UPI001C4857AC|nr:uncharacterized protein LOC121858527 isoform X4 [Homarus americanus]